jgi:hypothetical protein
MTFISLHIPHVGVSKMNDNKIITIFRIGSAHTSINYSLSLAGSHREQQLKFAQLYSRFSHFRNRY